jgi:hypothetical protein
LTKTKRGCAYQNSTEYVFKAQIFTNTMTSRQTSKKHASKTRKTRARKAHRTTRTTHQEKTHPHEHREQLHRARRALRALRHLVILPKAVIHTTKMHVPERMLEEVPEQAMIEHWEALNELKNKGIEIRSTRVPTRQHLTREIELDAPVSAHARHFAAQHGLIVRERKNPWRSSLERIFG